MYEFVEKRIADRYRSECSSTLKKVQTILLEEYDINTQFTLIGSGARNFITRNGNGPFDLDYNIIILDMPHEYWQNLRKLKETIRCVFNHVEKNEWFSDAKDSKSVLTAILYFEDTPDKEFSFDIAILSKNKNEHYQRLIHDKYNNRFYWNEIPNTARVKKRVAYLKHNNLWGEVRNTYLDKKNFYLRCRDTTHSSFVVYVETINEVYYRCIKFVHC